MTMQWMSEMQGAWQLQWTLRVGGTAGSRQTEPWRCMEGIWMGGRKQGIEGRIDDTQEAGITK